MTYYAYLFEVISIQKYIFNSGKLNEIVGASELLETLIGVSGPIDDLLLELDLHEHNNQSDQFDFKFSRRGGAAFYIIFTNGDSAYLFRKIWSLLVNGMAPGMEYSHAIGVDKSQKEAIKKGQSDLRTKRNMPQLKLPEVGPFVRRSPRTGMPAVGTVSEQQVSVWIDAGSSIKRKKKYSHGKALTNKFLDETERQKFEFPRNLEHKEGIEQVFPFNENNRYIGIIHADGNGLGQILIKLADELAADTYADVFFELSKKIDEATQAAAKIALSSILSQFDDEQDEKTVLPVRPIILGGDDLTIIVRGDLALKYTEEFLIAFEKESKESLKTLSKKHKEIPSQMSACAGVAFIKSNQPFYLGYQLAESLCDYAKTISRSNLAGEMIPSSLSFHRVTTSFIDNYSIVSERELSTTYNEEKYYMSMGAYGVGDFAGKLPQMKELNSLIEMFSNKAMSKGPTRHLLTVFQEDFMESEKLYKRWKTNMSEKMPDALKEYEQIMTTLFFEKPRHKESLPFAKEKENVWRTFMADITNRLAIEGELHEQ